VEEVRPTRAELLERRSQIALAQQGMDLLKQKRDALLLEFMGVMDETLRLSDSLQKTVSEAQYSLAVAQAVDGVVALRSAGLATKGEVVIDMTGTKIMGVSVPVVTKGDSPIKSSFTRGYAVTGVSSRVDETADKFERVLDVIIEYADIETRLKRLGEEINKTNRRVNALEQVTVPALREQVSYISQTLDERAREDLFRLKKVKKKIENKKRAASGQAGRS
jgi:V/A-type H+/Na+-transporting ATPase subunit D